MHTLVGGYRSYLIILIEHLLVALWDVSAKGFSQQPANASLQFGLKQHTEKLSNSLESLSLS